MDCPVAKGMAPAGQERAYLFDGEVRRLVQDRQDDILASLDAAGTPVATQSSRFRVALRPRQGYPPADACRADPEALSRRDATGPPPPPPRPLHEDRPKELSPYPPASDPAESLNHLSADSGIPADSFSSDDALVAVRDNPHLSSVPFIIATANSGETYIKQAFEAGATGYITKPYDAQSLQSVIEKCLAGT